MLCGCGSVHYSATVSSTGEVTLQLDLKFDTYELSEKLALAEKDISDFKYTVQNYARAVFNSSYNDFVQELNAMAVDGYVETYSGKATIQQVNQYVLQNTKFSDGTGNWSASNDACTIILKFETFNAYRYFNGIYPSTEDEVDEDVEEFRKDYFFYAEDYTVSKSVFNNIQNKSFTQYFIQYFNNVVDVDDMTYTYSYSTPSTKVYSDADEISYDEKTGNIIHTWNFTTDELTSGNGIITTYQVKIRAWVWYVLAVLISIITGVVIYVIVVINEKKQKEFLETNSQNLQQTSREIREKNHVELVENSKPENDEITSEKKDDENNL